MHEIQIMITSLNPSYFKEFDISVSCTNMLVALFRIDVVSVDISPACANYIYPLNK